jgi:pantoate--beta-alanine ligase
MGALHAGHFALLDRARAECDRVAATVFVNPAQFGPGEDLERYPRAPEEDLAGCRARGVDLVLLPRESGPDGIYPEGFQTWAEVAGIAAPLEGERRPGHFRGVATVVTILFGIFRPHRAYFGQKDFQQARVIERLSRDLRLGAQVVLVPTVREQDGLAMSSRNRYLSSVERARAAAIYRSLREAEERFRAGEVKGSRLEELVAARLGESGLRLDYARVLDATTLQPLEDDRLDLASEGAVLAVAAFAGRTRLIDSVWLRPAGAARRGEGPGDAGH